MINREEFNRALRLAIAILILSISILAFLWINFLYSRFSIETEDFRAQNEASIEAVVRDKAGIVARQADEFYEEETELLQSRMLNRMNLIKSNLFDYADLPEDVLITRLEEDGEQFQQRSGIAQHIVSEKYGFEVGQAFPIRGIASQHFEQYGDMLYYYEYSAGTRSHIQLQINQQDHLQGRLMTWIREYMELEPHILLIDGNGSVIAGSETITPEFESDNYLALANSEKSGYTLGYYRPKAELNERLAQRQHMFQRFLDNHLIEIAAFLVLLIVTIAVFFGMLARQHNRQLTALNDAIIQRYREPNGDGNELYREYGLSRAIDSLTADAQKQREYIEMLERKQSRELKQARIELLQMERRYEYLIDEKGTEAFTKFTPLQEKVDIKAMIEDAHAQFDPEAGLDLYGEEATIISDPAILQNLIETFFRLSSSPEHCYEVEYMVESGFLKLLLTLGHSGAIQNNDVERMKYLAGLLGGSVLRLHQEEDKFILVLRLLNQES